MTDFVLVEILDTRKYLLEKFASVLFFESLPFHNKVEQLSASGMFHNQKQLPVRLNYLVELYHVGVSDYFEDLNLPGHAFNIGLVLDLVFLENFDGYLFPSECMSSQSDFSESALAQSLAYMP